MTHITDAILSAVIGPLPDFFESHDVIQGLMTSYPQEYVRELHDKVSAADPIQTTHSVIGRTLHRIPGIAAVNRTDSPNVRGPVTENQRWRKLPPGTTGPAADAPQQ